MNMSWHIALYKFVRLTHRLSMLSTLSFTISVSSARSAFIVQPRFHSVTPKTAQNNEHFCAYRHSMVLHPIISVTPIDARGKPMNARTTNMPTRQHQSKGLLIDVPLYFYYFLHVYHCIQKARGSWSMYLSASTFYTHIIVYKKWRARNWCTYLLLLLFTRASSRTTSKGLPTSTSSYFSYMFIITYEKARGSHIHPPKSHVLSKLCQYILI
jgi:hypothetical protein